MTRPDLRVFFIIGYAENAVSNHGYLGQGMQVMTKPFEMEALAKRAQTGVTLNSKPVKKAIPRAKMP